ncbi:hypothetical protein JTB14_007165 [Gonioctena quinquepunctata]|nr:hypothetical protein JTB14_007165 [Gonioctena quinquepunctata]
MDNKDADDNFFNRERILILLDLYKFYKPKVGRGEVKTVNKMWEKIAFDLSNGCRITIHPSKCENKWKVLERSYKKVVDNNNRTGRRQEDFPYEIEFNDIFDKKVNITPKILLHSSEALVPSKPIPNEIPSSSKVHQVMENVPSISMASQFQNEENENPVISLPERQEEPKRRRKGHLLQRGMIF